MPFSDYLKRLGLHEKEKIDPKKVQQEKSKALSVAEQIKQLDLQQQHERK